MQIEHDMPWHQPLWQQLRQAVQSQRLPHALLLSGPQGVGKREFARRLSGLMLCKAADWETLQVCGQCDACLKFRNAAHPDFRHFSPQEGKREIVVEDIRSLLKFIQLSPQANEGYKVALVEPANSLNRHAANALLKTLEEPPARRLIILVTDALGRIPATIRSRCRILRFGLPHDDQALAWLSQETGRKIDISMLERQDFSVMQTLKILREEGGEKETLAREDIWRDQWLKAVRQPGTAVKTAEQWAEAEEPLILMRWLLRENLRATRQSLGVVRGNQPDIFSKAGLDLQATLIIQNKINELMRISSTTLNAKLYWATFLLDCHRMSSGELTRGPCIPDKET